MSIYSVFACSCFFYLKDTATTEIYTYGHTLSLHDALPICSWNQQSAYGERKTARILTGTPIPVNTAKWSVISRTSVIYLACGYFKQTLDRKSTRMNSSH